MLQSPRHNTSAGPPVAGATMKNNTLAIALASLLVGGVAVAAFQNSRNSHPAFTTADPAAQASLAAGDAPLNDLSVADAGRVQYAQVVNVKPLTEKQKLYAQVIGTDPVRETRTT